MATHNGEFSRHALARLVLSDRAVWLADQATTLVITLFDAYTGPGGRSSEAALVLDYASELLNAAVVYERERGASWAEIAQYLDADAAAVEERFAPAIDRWNETFTTRSYLELLRARDCPHCALRSLDLWAYLRISLNKHRASVSAGLDGQPPERIDVEKIAVEGVIPRHSFGAFMDSLSRVVESDLEVAEWDLTDLAVAADTDPREWVSLVLDSGWETVDVRVADAGDDFLSVMIFGDERAELRIRLDTLLRIYA